MELQFDQQNIGYLCRTALGERSVEQTGEIRVPEQEHAPNVVLGAWGQPLLLEKEWIGDSAAISGGVNVWVLLKHSEDGTVHCVEGWIPFKQTWDLHDSHGDGDLLVQCSLQEAEARLTGAGKLIVTVRVSVSLQALEQCSLRQYCCRQLPPDVYTLETKQALALAVETGEKRTTVEEELILPPGKEAVKRILYYRVAPDVFERKLMGDKLVFRGAVKVHFIYEGMDGKISACDGDFPVSQYIQLDREYGSSAVADVLPVVTMAEIGTSSEGKVSVRCGVLWQYLIHDTVQAVFAKDAYSNVRPVELFEDTQIATVLSDRGEGVLSSECAFEVQSAQVLDHAVMTSCLRHNEKSGMLEAEGVVQLLYYDDDGALQSAVTSWSGSSELGGASACVHNKQWTVACAENGSAVKVSLPYGVLELTECRLTGVSGLGMPEEPNKKENRPSLILCRPEGRSLWQLAKACGSSERAIIEANNLEEEPRPEKMLLIPVE